MIRIISRGTCIFVKIITNVHTHMWPLINQQLQNYGYNGFTYAQE